MVHPVLETMNDQIGKPPQNIGVRRQNTEKLQVLSFDMQSTDFRDSIRQKMFPSVILLRKPKQTFSKTNVRILVRHFDHKFRVCGLRKNTMAQYLLFCVFSR